MMATAGAKRVAKAALLSAAVVFLSPLSALADEPSRHSVGAAVVALPVEQTSCGCDGYSVYDAQSGAGLALHYGWAILPRIRVGLMARWLTLRDATLLEAAPIVTGAVYAGTTLQWEIGGALGARYGSSRGRPIPWTESGPFIALSTGPVFVVAPGFSVIVSFAAQTSFTNVSGGNDYVRGRSVIALSTPVEAGFRASF